MHVNTFVISFYTIFLRDLFINFDRVYYKPATRVFILKEVWFLWIYFGYILNTSKHIGYKLLQHFLNRHFYKFSPILL